MRLSAGLLCYRYRAEAAGACEVQVFLVHPGGPFWARKDARAWSIPKGELAPDEAPLAAAKREFTEETGIALAQMTLRSDFVALPLQKPHGGKILHTFAVEADFDASALRSNMFPLEWPPRSGLIREFPEVDRWEWFGLSAASGKLHAGQAGLPDALQALLRNDKSKTRGQA